MLQAVKTFALSLGCGTLRSVKGRDDRVVSLPVRCGDAGVLLILSATDRLDRSNRTITTKARILGRFRPLRPGLRFTDRQEDIIFNNLPWDDERLRAALGLFLNPDGSACKRAVINSLYHKDKPEPPETIDALWCALAEFAPALLARVPREAPLPPTFSVPKRRLAPGRHIPSSKLFSALRVDYGLPAPTSIEDAKANPVHVQVGDAWLSLLLDRDVTVTPKGAIDVMALLQATPSTEAAQAESARALTRAATGRDHAENADSTAPAPHPKASHPFRGKRSPATSQSLVRARDMATRIGLGITVLGEDAALSPLLRLGNAAARVRITSKDTIDLGTKTLFTTLLVEGRIRLPEPLPMTWSQYSQVLAFLRLPPAYLAAEVGALLHGTGQPCPEADFDAFLLPPAPNPETAALLWSMLAKRSPIHMMQIADAPAPVPTFAEPVQCPPAKARPATGHHAWTPTLAATLTRSYGLFLRKPVFDAPAATIHGTTIRVDLSAGITVNADGTVSIPAMVVCPAMVVTTAQANRSRHDFLRRIHRLGFDLDDARAVIAAHLAASKSLLSEDAFDAWIAGTAPVPPEVTTILRDLEGNAAALPMTAVAFRAALRDLDLYPGELLATLRDANAWDGSAATFLNRISAWSDGSEPIPFPVSQTLRRLLTERPHPSSPA